MVGPVLKCPDAPPAISRPAPRAGEHTEEVLSEMRRRPGIAVEKPAGTNGANTLTAGPLKHPLQGIRIIDFGSYFAGPSASKMLADLGADVIKVEPLVGDTLRGSPGAFRAAQRGKRAIAFDAKSPEGKIIVRKLIETADVVTHNMRPGGAERAGIGYEELSGIRPGLIYLHSPGFGNAGPRSHLQAFAPLVSAMAGLSTQAAGRGNPPLLWWSTNEDQLSGGFGASWVLMALNHRRRTGRGVRIESSLFGTAIMAASEVILDANDNPVFRFEIDQQQTGYGALCRLYKAQDGWIVLVVILEAEWRALCKVDGLQNLAERGQFQTRAGRAEHDADLAAILERWFGQRSCPMALSALAIERVPCELSAPSKIESWFFDEANLKNGRVVRYRHAEAGEIRETGHSIRFSETPGLIRGPAPLLGEQTREILQELGYSDSEIEGLRERRIVTWKGAVGSEGAIS